jgi:hypothetical protein
MMESNPKASGTWTWVGILGAIAACMGLMSVSVGCLLLVIFYAAMLNQPPSISSSTQVPFFQNTPMPPEDGSFVGLWQFPDRTVWIKITEEGQAFQCRIDKDGTVYRSAGTIIGGDQIYWQENWGIDSITREANRIALDGKYGKFEYEFTDIPMDPACEAPF